MRRDHGRDLLADPHPYDRKIHAARDLPVPPREPQRLVINVPVDQPAVPLLVLALVHLVLVATVHDGNHAARLRSSGATRVLLQPLLQPLHLQLRLGIGVRQGLHIAPGATPPIVLFHSFSDEQSINPSEFVARGLALSPDA